ncbi:hypothetical protein JTE90_027472, partial [Oedothorax gibbosus]
MSSTGKISEFHPESDDAATYVMRLKHFMVANKIEDNNKLSVLITVLGSKVINTLVDLVTPDELDSKTYDQIIELFLNQYKPEKLTVVERNIFNTRRQKQFESVQEYIIELKHLASTCKFGTFLNEALRDRLVSGVLDEELRQKLIIEDITFTKACEIAVKYEQAQKQSNMFQKQAAFSNDINSLKKFKSKPTKFPTKLKFKCTRCNSNSHFPNTCRYKTFKCERCQKIGHLKRACWSNLKINQVEREDKYLVPRYARDQPTDDLDNHMYAVKSNRKKGVKQKSNKVTEDELSTLGFVCEMEIEGRKMSLQIDTGACTSTLPERIYRKVPQLKRIPVIPTKLSLSTYLGETLEVKGKIYVKVKYKNGEYVLPLIVVNTANEKAPILLGRNWLEHIKLDWQSIFAVENNSTEILLKDLKSKYQDVFEPGTGIIKSKQIALHVKEDAVPKFCKHRPVPFAIKPLVDKEIDRLLEDKIIKRVKTSEWATPLVVVRKPNKNVRLCADYKITLNPVLEVEHYPLPTTEELFSELAEAKVFTVLDLSHAYLQLPIKEESQ